MAFSAPLLLRSLEQLPNARRHLLACSGGLDSIVLLHALVTLRDQGLYTTPFEVVHVDHRLQDSSHEWALWVGKVCDTFSIPHTTLVVHAAPKAGESPEAAAREARYAAIEPLLAASDLLLTAHHADDQAETLLLRLLRGSGVRGLASMATTRSLGRGTLARPLLGFSRMELQHYAQREGLEWIDDPSNQSLTYDRNHLRHRIIPALRERWPALVSTLGRSAAHCREASALLDELAEIDLQGSSARLPLPVMLLQPLSTSRQGNLLRYWISAQGAQLPEQRHLESLRHQALQAKTDAVLSIRWGSYEVRRYRGRLYLLQPVAPMPESLELEWDLRAPLLLPAGLGKLVAQSTHSSGLDSSKVGSSVTVTLRRGGERCRPEGSAHSRSLKQLLQESDIPPWERGRLPIICVGSDLAQVANLWRCDEYACGPDAEGIEIRWHNG